MSRHIPKQGEHPISITHGDRVYRGTYSVESGVASLWANGPEGTKLGPMTVVLRGTRAEAAAETLLREYAEKR